MADILDQITEIGGGLVAMALVVVVLTFLFGPVAADLSIGTGGTTNVTDDVGVLGGSTTLSSTPDTFNFAKTSLNDAVLLTGAGSNVTIDSNANVGTQFSACTYAQANSSVVTNNETRILMATEQAVIQYNGSTNEWQGYYYNASSRNSYRTAASASSPTTPTLVCLNAVGSYVNVTANTSAGPNTVTTADNIAAYPQGDNWEGVVEETRIYEDPLNGSQRADWVAEPVLAVDGEAPAARVTFDEFGGYDGVFTAYFGGGTATATGANPTTGRAGPSLTQGVDYSISGNTFTILGGGQLNDNGEVLYLNYVGNVAAGPYAAVWGTIANTGPAALSLLVVVFLIGAAAAVMGAFDDDW